ncbi:tRNA (N6-isopentenyl adenosine(37)-C2)-methylthiotransferase MiaB [bacterium]|nr:tRNA (N6-isopentenyl adenosine(37)-C2)-methylthiotransferase MiaB [bacterium]
MSSPALANPSISQTNKAMDKKKIHIKTYGCQMNFYDSSRMAELMKPLGYELSEKPDDADMVVLNTCHIREKASEKMYSDLGRIKRAKQKLGKNGKRMLVAVAGCVAQAEGEEITRRAPYVDIVVGPQTFQRLPDLVAKSLRDHAIKGGGEKIHELDFAVEEKFDKLAIQPPEGATQAFLTIQEGCDKFCTFCVVPYTRGGEYSRPVNDVLAEARTMAAGGVVEVTLLGQNVNAYHGMAGGGEWNLAKLCHALAEIPGITRIRYTTSHPRDMDDALIQAHADLPQLMPYLHLPVQSGSDRILAAMNRKHTAKHYLNIIEKLRKARPDIALSTDIIVGFPGETDEDFEATMQLVRKVGYAQSYSFKYSIRPGTPAASVEEQVPEEVKDARLQALQALLNQQLIDFNQSMVGQRMEILIEKPGKHAGQMVGRSPYLQSVHVDDCDLKPGQLAEVIVTGTTHFGLRAVLAETMPNPLSQEDTHLGHA